MTDAQLVRFAAVLTVLAGYVFVFRSGEDRIGERAQENARIVERIGAAERTLASRRSLEAERTQLRARLRAVDLGADRSALVARFLRDAARIASTRHTTIAAIVAGSTPNAPIIAGGTPNAPLAAPKPNAQAAGGALSPAVVGSGALSVPVAASGVAGLTTSATNDTTGEPFDAIALEVTVEGRYADVLATVRALSAARVLAAVEIASLARKNAEAADATLTAALHVVLHRLAPENAIGVRARPV